MIADELRKNIETVKALASSVKSFLENPPDEYNFPPHPPDPSSHTSSKIPTADISINEDFYISVSHEDPEDESIFSKVQFKFEKQIEQKEEFDIPDIGKEWLASSAPKRIPRQSSTTSEWQIFQKRAQANDQRAGAVRVVQHMSEKDKDRDLETLRAIELDNTAAFFSTVTFPITEDAILK